MATRNSHIARRRRGLSRGFTITEIIVVVIIIGVLAAVIAPRLIGRVGASKQNVALSQANTLATAMKLFVNDHYMPESGASIEILWTRPGDVEESKWSPYVDSENQLKDPWGNFYVLQIPPEVNADFDIVSLGKDGQRGGDGENQDIVNGQSLK